MTPHESPYQIAVESPDPCNRVIRVRVPRAEFEREYQDRLAVAVRSHERPGFRKGRTPRAAVEKELGDRLRMDAFEALVPAAYRAAVIEHELYPLTEPRLENLVFEPQQDLAFDLLVEVRPEVVARGYQDLPLTERLAEVRDGEVDEILTRLRQSRAWFELVARPAEAGDQVTLNVTPLGDDGEPRTERAIAGQRLIAGGEQNLPAFNDALVGAEAGQVRIVEATYPADYPNDEVRDRTVRFRCEVVEVRQQRLPEADDEFAGQLEEGQTLLELRVRIRERLQQEAERRAAAEMDEQVLSALIERHEVPVPPSMIEDYLRAGLEELHEHNRQIGANSNDAEDAQYREAARPVAERVIKGLFVLEAVRRQEDIKASDAEIDDRITVIAAENGFDLGKFKAYVDRGEERDRIRRELEERKTYDFLLSRAQIAPAQAQVAEAGE